MQLASMLGAMHWSRGEALLPCIWIFGAFSTLAGHFCKGTEFGDVTTGSKGQWLSEAGLRGRRRKGSREVKTWRENKRHQKWEPHGKVTWASTCSLHLGSSDLIADLGLIKASTTEKM